MTLAEVVEATWNALTFRSHLLAAVLLTAVAVAALRQHSRDPVDGGRIGGLVVAGVVGALGLEGVLESVGFLAGIAGVSGLAPLHGLGSAALLVLVGAIGARHLEGVAVAVLMLPTAGAVSAGRQAPGVADDRRTWWLLAGSALSLVAVLPDTEGALTFLGATVVLGLLWQVGPGRVGLVLALLTGLTVVALQGFRPSGYVGGTLCLGVPMALTYLPRLALRMDRVWWAGIVVLEGIVGALGSRWVGLQPAGVPWGRAAATAAVLVAGAASLTLRSSPRGTD